MKRVLITGAAGGIGSAAAAELRAEGARVVGLDLEAGDDVIACDVRDQASVDAAVAEAVRRLGGLDVLINNAGVGTPQSAGLAPDDRALAVIDVPVEDVRDAARTLARAALGPPARDLATTRNGAVGYALLRHLPRRLLDAVVRRRLARVRLPAS